MAIDHRKDWMYPTLQWIRHWGTASKTSIPLHKHSKAPTLLKKSLCYGPNTILPSDYCLWLHYPLRNKTEWDGRECDNIQAACLLSPEGKTTELKANTKVLFCTLLSDYAHRTEVKIKLIHIFVKRWKKQYSEHRVLSIRRIFPISLLKVQAVITEASTTKKMYLHSPLRACVLQNKSGVLVRTAAFRIDVDFKWTPDSKNCMHTNFFR